MRIILCFEGTKKVDGIDISLAISGEFNYAAHGESALSKYSPDELVRLFCSAPLLRQHLHEAMDLLRSPYSRDTKAKRAQFLQYFNETLARTYA